MKTNEITIAQLGDGLANSRNAVTVQTAFVHAFNTTTLIFFVIGLTAIIASLLRKSR